MNLRNIHFSNLKWQLFFLFFFGGVHVSDLFQCSALFILVPRLVPNDVACVS